MPTIPEAAHQLAEDGLPVLFIDTCVLLDVIRAPLRKIPFHFPVAVGHADALMGFIQDGLKARHAEIAEMFP